MAVSIGAILAACGARSGLPIPHERDASVGGEAPDAGPDVAPDVPPDVPPDVVPFDCADAGLTYIYLISSETALYSYYPADGTFTSIGFIDCVPDTPGATPFSMGVDRKGRAYVVYNDGELFRVNTANAHCEPTGFQIGQSGFTTFGMGFSTNTPDPGETLYVAEIHFNSPSLGLGKIDTDTLELTPIGPFSENPGFSLEMTGSGDGRLFGYFLDNPGPGGHVVEIEKTSGKILSSTAVSVGVGSAALAFATWGGQFYIFTSPGMGTTDVDRFNPNDGTVTHITTIDVTVVGAGVSTCAPSG